MQSTSYALPHRPHPRYSRLRVNKTVSLSSDNMMLYCTLHPLLARLLHLLYNSAAALSAEGSESLRGRAARVGRPQRLPAPSRDSESPNVGHGWAGKHACALDQLRLSPPLIDHVSRYSAQTAQS